MSLFETTLLTGAMLLLIGILCMRTKRLDHLAQMLRSQGLTVGLMALATLLFAWQILQLNQADFGEYKYWLLTLFVGTAALSIIQVPDFLSVRAASVLILLAAKGVLASAFLQEPESRLFLVSFTYLMIIAAFIFGAAPFLARDALLWLGQAPKRRYTAGSALVIYGALLVTTALNYS